MVGLTALTWCALSPPCHPCNLLGSPSQTVFVGASTVTRTVVTLAVFSLPPATNTSAYCPETAAGPHSTNAPRAQSQNCP